MGSAGCQRDKLIPGGHSTAIDDVIFLDDTNTKPCQIVVVPFINAGHFGSLATDQCTAREFATGPNAGHDVCRDINIEFAGGIVVQKKKGLCTDHRDVVAAHSHQVDAYRIVAAGIHSKPQLGANPIRPRYQYGTAIALGYLYQRAKASKSTQYFGPVCPRTD